MIKQSKLEIIYGQEVGKKIFSSNVLVVGAGGIGCELMKTLSLTGLHFQQNDQIDLDTIDISNLNRQFLFRKEHVDKSKSLVVKEQILKQNPNMQIESYVGKIQEDRFGFKFFSQFDVVINALDNEEARKHVNNLCFNLNIPLIDAGTNGYNATCISICKGKTHCYQCVSRKTDQTFPVCTIRQKPEKLIHCIVWAKALFEGLYGPKEQTNNMLDDILKEIDQTSQKQDSFQFASILFDRLFNKEPQTLQQNLLLSLQRDNVEESEKQSTLEFISKIKTLSFDHYQQQIELDLMNKYYPLNQAKNDQENSINILTLQEYIYMFIKSIITFQQNRSKEIGGLLFNKDDDNIVDFVSAATNIRAFNFSIPMESKFKIKEIAGKIIPAISSSNALVASLQVFEAIKVLTQKYEQLQGISYNRLSENRIQSFKRINEQPNPNCEICSDDSKHIYSLEIKDLKQFTLGNLIQRVLQQEIGLNNNLLIEFNSNIIYEFGRTYNQLSIFLDDDMDEDEIEIYAKKLKKCLYDIQIKDLSILYIQAQFKEKEESDQSKIYLQIFENSNLNEEFKLTLLKKGVQKLKVIKKSYLQQENSNQDFLEIQSDPEDDLTIQENYVDFQQLGKRKSEIPLNNENELKRQKQ